MSTADQTTVNNAPGEPTPVETIKIQGKLLTEKVKELAHEGNVRRIVVKNHDDHTVLEIPVNAGVIALVLAPIITAVGAIAALANDWTIEVHRAGPAAG